MLSMCQLNMNCLLSKKVLMPFYFSILCYIQWSAEIQVVIIKNVFFCSFCIACIFYEAVIVKSLSVPQFLMPSPFLSLVSLWRQIICTELFCPSSFLIVNILTRITECLSAEIWIVPLSYLMVTLFRKFYLSSHSWLDVFMNAL